MSKLLFTKLAQISKDFNDIRGRMQIIGAKMKGSDIKKHEFNGKRVYKKANLRSVKFHRKGRWILILFFLDNGECLSDGLDLRHLPHSILD